MFYVPLYFEAIRSRPAQLFWCAISAQAALWLAVPLLFYSSPPGDLAQVLAIGHEFQFDSDVGPPLAFWLAELSYRLGGLFGVYTLAQACVVVTYWCIFRLGSAIVGPSHAVIATLLMSGIALFTVPSPDFGPAVLTMPLWSFVLLQYWRAVVQSVRISWLALGAAAALLLLASEGALILLGTLALLTVLTERGRTALDRVEPWIVAAALVGVLFLHLLWLEGSADSLSPLLARLGVPAIARGSALVWLRLLGVLLVAHAGLGILVVLAGGWLRSSDTATPVLERAAADGFAGTFIKVMALVPALLATAIAAVLGRPAPVGGAAPLLILSGLAVVLAAGERLRFHHQRILGYAWGALLLLPAALVPAVMVLLPTTTGINLKVTQPTAAMGRFFADDFKSRTGRPLKVVTGDARTAALVALGAPTRPSVYFDVDPARSPSLTVEDIRKNGALVVWVTADTSPTPPANVRAYFPDLVAEVPRTFERLHGRLPPFRVGWAVIRPAEAAAAAHSSPE